MNTNEIKKIKNQVRLSQWIMQLNEQQESGLSATAWCKLNQIKVSTFFTRLRRIRDVALQNSKAENCNSSLPVSTSPFAEIDITNMRSTCPDDFSYDVSNNITVTLNGATIEIPNTAKVDLVTSILCVVKGL